MYPDAAQGLGAILGVVGALADSDSGGTPNPHPHIPVPGPVPASLLIISLGYKLWVTRRELATTSQSLNTARHNIEVEKRASGAAKRTAENAQRRQEEAERARSATERRWFEGVRPECRPSKEDIVRMKAAYHYSPDFLHIAVVGSSGGGKSSFINAVRGLSNNDPIAAPTGIVETTDAVTRYTDPCQDSKIFWYDVPGAGTPNMPDWQYFNNLGLYIFDCIIVLIDNRFSDSDLAILQACEQFTNIEVFIVRSKSDQHINNMVLDRMPRGFDPFHADDESRSRFQQVKSEIRREFIDKTYQNVQTNLESNNIPPKRVYIVCKDAVHAIWNNSPSPMAIDEEELQNDVAEYVRRRLHRNVQN